MHQTCQTDPPIRLAFALAPGVDLKIEALSKPLRSIPFPLMRSPQPPAYAGDGVTQVQGEKWEILEHHDTSESETGILRVLLDPYPVYPALIFIQGFLDGL